MRKNILLLATVSFSMAIHANTLKVEVSNPSSLERENETIEVLIEDINKFMGDINENRLRVTDKSGNQIPSQITYDGKIIFQTTLDPKAKAVYTIEDEADENLKLRDSIGVLESCPGKIDVFTFHQIELVIEEFMSEPNPVEQMPCTDFLSRTRLDHPEILPDANVVSDSFSVEPSDPFLADKFPVGHKAVYAVITEEVNELLHKKSTLLPIRVAALRQKSENQRECYSSVGYAEHKDVDVYLAEFPVGTVHGKNDLSLGREKAKYHPCDEVKTQRILYKEPLESAHVGIPLHACRHSRSQLMETDGLNHAESMDYIRHQLYAGKIHCFSKMFLHNRVNLVNFDQVFGISSFHGDKSSNLSSKLLIFRNLYKYNYLKFRYLTA